MAERYNKGYQFSHTKIKTTNNNKTENALVTTHFPYKNKNKGFFKISVRL